MTCGSCRARLAIAIGLVVCAATSVSYVPGQSADPKSQEWGMLAKSYTQEIRPIVQRYCQRCHGAKRTEADLNLDQIETFAQVRKHPRTWQKVAEMLDTSQMPPKEAKQPTDTERARLQHW